MIERISEESLNVTLAHLLSRYGLKALGEVSVSVVRRRRPDVIISINNFRIILEGKKDPNRLSEAISQCEDRVDNGIADICLAIVYRLFQKRNRITDFVGGISISQRELEDLLRTMHYDVVVITYIDRAFYKGRLYEFLKEHIRFRGEYKRYENISFDELFAIIMQSYEFTISSTIVDEIVSMINAKLELFKDIAKDRKLIERLAKELELKRR